MKRTLPVLAVVLLAIATLVRAQGASQATLQTATGTSPVSFIQQGAVPFFAADEIAAAIGAKLVSEAGGYRFTHGAYESVLGTDSRFAILRDDLIELPQAPIVIESRLFVPLPFFQSFVRTALGQELRWDAATRQLRTATVPREALGVQVSVVDLQDFSKVVLQLTGPSEYTISREGTAWTIRFKNPLTAPFPEQTYEDPLIGRVSFAESAVRIDTRAPEIGAEAYRLENPFRVVLDFRKGAAAPLTPSLPGKDLRPIETPGVRIIVLDPGHGGREVGAVGPNGVMEKDITLAICRQAAELIASRLGARVFLTRYDDAQVPLEQRTTLANQYKADLFLSVHLNAAVVRGASGSETYFLSLEASDELARRAAERENEGQSPTAAPSATSDLKMILWDLAQQDYLKESSRLAEIVQEEMNVTIGSQNRGVKQAPFKVLIGATMPAALVELGFISNPEEEAKLSSADFQAKLAETITRAVERYKGEYEARVAPPMRPSTATAPAPAAAATTTTGTAPVRTNTGQ